jgi:hypothetical protein
MDIELSLLCASVSESRETLSKRRYAFKEREATKRNVFRAPEVDTDLIFFSSLQIS